MSDEFNRLLRKQSSGAQIGEIKRLRVKMMYITTFRSVYLFIETGLIYFLSGRYRRDRKQ